jgi:putative DNA methylase
MIISPKKLIEVALPLDAINAAAAREKSIRHGHPSTLHLWWARRPLAAARAVIFAQLVHDPEDLWRCQNPGVEPNPQVRGHWTKARARLFKIIEDLVLWENTTNEAVLKPARDEIRKAWQETCELNKDHPQAQELFNPEKMPGLHDPFAGGGSIPLEAQRLGLEAFASDLNPVAVLINKAMIEIPPKFAGKPPVHPASRGRQPPDSLFDADSFFDTEQNPAANAAGSPWSGAAGLAEDVRRYGAWMRDEAYRRIGHLYPPIEITAAMVKERPDLKQYEGEKLTVIAWLWARTVKSPNPAFAHVDVPLASTFILSSKKGKEAYVQPVIHKPGEPGVSTPGFSFTVKVGKPPTTVKTGTSFGKQKGFRCLMSQTPVSYEYIREEALAGRMGQRLMAIVAEGTRGRVYLTPTAEQEALADTAKPEWKPDLKIPKQALGFRVQLYGMLTFGELFTPRQLVALTTFSDLVGEARERIRRDALAAGLLDDDRGLDVGGTGAKAYAEAVSVYLGMCSSKLSAYHCTLAIWRVPEGKSARAFGRQAIPMTWDYAECNPFAEAGGEISGTMNDCAKVLDAFTTTPHGHATQVAAQTDSQTVSNGKYVSTDPPYYDNVGYADLSDFYYVWLRRSLRSFYPTLLSTISVPKKEELVATPYRHGSKKDAETYFLEGMSNAIHRLAWQTTPAAPITIYYAFKQSETESQAGTSSTGWETFLEAVLRAGFSLTGTWPMRTESSVGLKNNINSLASSVILVCRPRAKNAGTISRRQFVRMLNQALPLALDAMTRESEGLNSPVAPVDLSQAIIGPGMAIFSRYDAVLEADGTPMSVRIALQLINRFLAEDDFDADTQFCLHWFEQHGWETGKFGEADTLARAKGTSVAGVQHAGVLAAGGGNVRLLKWKELDIAWEPATDPRIPVWQVLHQLIQAFNKNGDSGAAKVLAATASKAEAARQLAYRLYTLCERRNWAEDARAYNEVVTGWSGIESAAVAMPTPKQGTLFGEELT